MVVRAALIFILILVGSIIPTQFALAQAFNDVSRKKQDTFKIVIPAFKQNTIPKKYTCDGDNISPPIFIRNVPKGTKTLALIMDDPDAPGGTFTHWLVWNISPKKTKLLEGEKSLSFGVNDFGNARYDGPCPPSGTHRYFFKLYALDTKINVKINSVQELNAIIKNHAIDNAVTVAKYSRS